jgi:CheY-like chemotaxis protein
MTAGPTHRMTTETAGADGPVIYVVDDDKAIRLALGALLRSVGLRVEAFESPDEFLRFPHSSGPSCLILDVRLRGKSGMAFHQEIVNSGMRMPVLYHDRSWRPTTERTGQETGAPRRNCVSRAKVLVDACAEPVLRKPSHGY